MIRTHYLLAAAVVALSANAAFGQVGTTNEGTATRTDERVDTAPSDIVVTAQRRAERLIDVPVSLVATSGERLEQLNLTASTDLQFVTPGLALGDANTPRGAGFRIRGIGTNVFSDGIEQSVGTVVDNVPLARAAQGLADLVDVERVEVLRGPQGLLFGRNASAGLINIVTRKPTDELSVIANASYGSSHEVKLSGSLSGPLASGFTARLSGYLNRQDGFVQDVATGQYLNNRNEYGVRGTLRWASNDERVEVLLRGDWANRKNNCCVWTVRQFATPATDPRPGTVFLRTLTGPIDSGPAALQVAGTGSYQNRLKNRGVSGEINVKLGDYTLTSVSAYRRLSQVDNNDADLSRFNVLDVNTGTNELDQTSQEFRLTSPNTGRVQFVAGLFYFLTHNYAPSSQIGRFANSLALAGAAGIGIPLAPGLVLPPNQLFGRDTVAQIRTRDYAAFGQATIDLTERFALIAGARVTNTRVDVNFSRVGSPGANAFNFLLGGQFAPLAFSGSTSNTNFSWRLGAQYKPTPDQTLYASVARGYKGPGYATSLDTVIPAGQNAANYIKVNPEIPTNYEVGYKASLFNRNATFSLAIFRTDFKDFQAQVVDTIPGSAIGAFVVRNAGKLRSQGVEAELTARVSPALSIDAGLSYNDAKFVSFTGAACPRQGALVITVGAPCGPLVVGGANTNRFDASGQAATNAPRWSGNLGFRIDVPTEGSARPFAQANVYARSSTTFALYPTNIPNPTVQKAYAVVNGSAGVTVFDGKLQAAVFVRNFFNQNYVTSIFDLPFDGAGGFGQFVTRDAQRTVGVQLNLKY